MPRSAASDLVYTVCECPFYGTPDINGLSINVKPSLQSGTYSIKPTLKVASININYVSVNHVRAMLILINTS